jgi:pilus assembly protein Flp/PilA
MRLFKDFLSDQSGATAIEYGLIAGLIALGIIASLTQVKEGIFQVWNAIANGLSKA